MQAGQQVSFEHQIENSGSTDAGKTRVTYWLSLDNTAGNAGDVNLGNVDVLEILRSRPAQSGRIFNVPAGTAAGSYKLFWVIDLVGDANAANNTGALWKGNRGDGAAGV